MPINPWTSKENMMSASYRLQYVPVHARDLPDSTNSPLYAFLWKPMWLRRHWYRLRLFEGDGFNYFRFKVMYKMRLILLFAIVIVFISSLPGGQAEDVAEATKSLPKEAGLLGLDGPLDQLDLTKMFGRVVWRKGRGLSSGQWKVSVWRGILLSPSRFG